MDWMLWGSLGLLFLVLIASAICVLLDRREREYQFKQLLEEHERQKHFTAEGLKASDFEDWGKPGSIRRLEPASFEIQRREPPGISRPRSSSARANEMRKDYVEGKWDPDRQGFDAAGFQRPVDEVGIRDSVHKASEDEIREKLIQRERRRRDADDGFDHTGLAFGLLTGMPISPARGVSPEAVVGSMLHAPSQPHASPAPAYEPPATSAPDTTAQETSHSSNSSSGGGDSGGGGGGGE